MQMRIQTKGIIKDVRETDKEETYKNDSSLTVSGAMWRLNKVGIEKGPEIH